MHSYSSLKIQGKCTCNAVAKYFRFNCIRFLNRKLDNATEPGGYSAALKVCLWVIHVYTEREIIRHKWSNHKGKLENERDIETVPYLSRLVAGISPRKIRFDPRPVDVVVAMENVAIK